MQSLGVQLGSPALRYRSALLRDGHGLGGGPAKTKKPFPTPPLLGNEIEPQQTPSAATHQALPRARLEAVLLLSREPITLRKMTQLAGLEDATQARTLLAELQTLHNERGSAFEILRVGGGYQLLTRTKLAPWLDRLAPTTEPARLSPPALETLAIVAYRQPVVRAEIEAIRGVGCGEMLRQLMERDLLRIVGRTEELGRPLLYGTTKAFLSSYGLNNLSDLPQADQLSRSQTARPTTAA